MYFNIGNNKIKMANIYYTKDTFLFIRYFSDNIISLQCTDVLISRHFNGDILPKYFVGHSKINIKFVL